MPNESELDTLACKLDALKVPVHRVVEVHGKYAGQLMALGIMPGPKSVRGRYLSNVPLLSINKFAEASALWQTWRVTQQSLSAELTAAQKALAKERSLTNWQRLKRWATK